MHRSQYRLFIANYFNIGDIIINKPISSTMQRILADPNKGIMLLPEIYDPINKSLKSDEDNASGDAQLLCELFSGEETTYRFATERSRKIERNTPFTIVGCTQLPYAARLIARMDQGHGLLDHMNITIPNCLRPSPKETTDAAKICEKYPLKSIQKVLYEMHTTHLPKIFKFNEEAEELKNELNTEFIEEMNKALLTGEIPPKSKKIDIASRIAVAIHCLETTMHPLINGQKPPTPSELISCETLKKAFNYVEYMNTQKDILTEVMYYIEKLNIV